MSNDTSSIAAALVALLVEVFARCDTAAAACDELGMRRTARGETMVAPVSALRRAAQRAGVPWPYTARGGSGVIHLESRHVVGTGT